MNIGDFAEFDKIGNFGDLLPISSIGIDSSWVNSGDFGNNLPSSSS